VTGTLFDLEQDALFGWPTPGGVRILVVGSRLFADRDAIAEHLDAAAHGQTPVIVHGQCDPRDPAGHVVPWTTALRLCGAALDRLVGADWLTHRHATTRGWAEDPHPANWAKHGRGAGPIRNREMVRAGADIALIFLLAGADNRGSKDCQRRAQAAGIPVRVIEREAE
jgi:hypothetical protein